MKLCGSMGSLLATSLLMGLAVIVATTESAPASAAGIASSSCAPSPTGPTVTVPPLASFSATAPQRLVDTRDGTGGVHEPIGAGCTLRVRAEGADEIGDVTFHIEPPPSGAPGVC